MSMKWGLICGSEEQIAHALSPPPRYVQQPSIAVAGIMRMVGHLPCTSPSFLFSTSFFFSFSHPAACTNFTHTTNPQVGFMTDTTQSFRLGDGDITYLEVSTEPETKQQVVLLG